MFLPQGNGVRFGGNGQQFLGQKDRTFHQKREEHQVGDVIERSISELINKNLHAEAHC